MRKRATTQTTNGAGSATEWTVPVDVVNEQVLITACLVDEDTRDRLVARIGPESFSGDRAVIWGVLRDMSERGLTTDLATLQSLAGGNVDVAALQQWMALRPDVPENLDYHVGALAWDRMRASAVEGPLTSFLTAIKDPNEAPERVGQLAQHLADAFAKGNPSRPWRTIRERATRMGTRPRVLLGLTTLDAATRGGVPCGKLVIVAGAPGSYKTSLQAAVGYQLVARGVATAFACYDEGADEVLVRIGQNHGLDRTALESGDKAQTDKLVEWIESVPLLLVDAKEEHATIEAIATALRARAGDGPAVLLVDSLQTLARAYETTKGFDRRLSVDAVVDVLQGLARRLDLAIIASSEVGRGHYRSKNEHDRTTDLAAAKESGGIEFGCDLLLVMHNVEGSSLAVDVAMPKNRMGPKVPFRLRFDSDRASFAELDANNPVDAAIHDAEFERRQAEMRKHLLDVIRTHPGLTNKTAIAKATRGRKSELLGVLDLLIADGVVLKTDAGFVVVEGNGKEGST